MGRYCGCFANHEDNIWPDRRHKFVSCRIFGSLLTRQGLLPAFVRRRTQHCADITLIHAELFETSGFALKVFHMLYDSTIGKTKTDWKLFRNPFGKHATVIDTCLKTCILSKNAGDPKLEETKQKRGSKGEIWKESS